jgi:hypothetical protein
MAYLSGKTAENHGKILARIADSLAKFQIRYLPNTFLEHWCYTSVLDPKLWSSQCSKISVMQYWSFRMLKN